MNFKRKITIYDIRVRCYYCGRSYYCNDCKDLWCPSCSSTDLEFENVNMADLRTVYRNNFQRVWNFIFTLGGLIR